MDVYSFGMLCLWLIFEAGSPGSLPLLPNWALKRDHFISFERYPAQINLIQDWKGDSNNKLVEWMAWLVREDGCFDSSIKDNLV